MPPATLRARALLRLTLVLAALLVAGYGAVCWYLWAQQRELIFLPTRELRQTPADAGLPYADVRVPVGGSRRVFLHGWWLEGRDNVPQTFLYFHGNDLNLGGNVERIARLNRMGFAVFAVDYRGYGKSEGGFPSEQNVYEDAEAAWDHLVEERRVDPRQTFIYGHSLGAAVAIELALRHPNAGGLVVESAFTSIADLAKNDYRLFPVEWLLNQRFDALARIPLVRVPTLFIHGTADREVPYVMSERLFAAAKGPKRLVLIAGGGHEDSPRADEASYVRAVIDFTKRVEDGRTP